VCAAANVLPASRRKITQFGGRKDGYAGGTPAARCCGWQGLKLLPFRQIALLSAVSKARSLARYWLPVVIWMAVIFSASGDNHSFQRSSRIIGPVVRWLFPRISEATLNVVVTAVRKGAHVAEYAILGLLLLRAWRKPIKADPRPWSWREAGGIIVVVALYAASDEIHQTFIPARQGSAGDVMIDTAGASLGMLLLWAWGRWRQGWR
jgi:VanZ family protein